MTLSLLKYPARISLVDDPVLFRINTDNQYSSAGSKADITFEITNIDTTAGHNFTLSCEIFSIIFTLAAAPDESGEQLPVATAGMTNGEWTALLFEYLKLNYYLDKYYKITRPSATFIKLTARSNGVDYTLTFSDSNVTGLSEDSNNAGTDPVARDFYNIHVTTFLLNWHGTKILLGDDHYVPDDDGDILHNASEWLKPEPISSFNWPDDITNLIFEKEDAVQRFFIQYTETYGTPPLNKIINSTLSKITFAIPGGLDHMNLAINNLNNTDFYNELLQKRPFLTWQPKEKVISKTQPEKLFFLVLDASVTEVRLMINLYWTDGTSTSIIKKTQSNVSVYELYEFVVGCNKLDLESVNPAKTVKEYEIYLTKQAGVYISETRKYIIDTKVYSRERAFIFRNSLGWYDTLRTTGEVENVNEYDRSLVDVIIEEDFTNTDAKIQAAEIEESQLLSANTGLTDDIEKVNWFRDLFLSKEVYEVLSGILYPVVLTSKKIFIRKDNEYPYSGQFEYIRAYTDNHYAKDSNMVYSGPVYNSSFNSSYQQAQIL